LERVVAFPLRRKLGLFAVAMLLILSAVCGVGVHHFLTLRTDAKRLLEESRELGLANDLDAHFESIGHVLQLGDVDEAAPETRAFLHEQAKDVNAILLEMNDAPGDDPSRREHQAEELEVSHALDRRLGALDRSVDGPDTSPPLLDAAHIAELRGLGARLEEEAREEARHAERDLRERSRRALTVMLITTGLAVLGLVVMLLLVQRQVLRPLRALERRAEALGHGDFRPGPKIETNDEIGALANAFTEMAGKIAATQNALTDRVAARTRELVRAARYADLGVLAAGVAHEINNPLATIATCAEGLQRRIERGTLDRKDQDEYLRTITSEAYRARDITQRLLALARQDAAPAARVELRPLLQELQRVTKHQLERQRVTIAVEAAPDLAVLGDSGELLQALVNLVLNARDASPAGKRVRITAARHEDAVVIDVDDEGPGVPPELMERIFEPFFTTKGPGEGTGLGLPLVAAIVENHGGSIIVSRSPQGGARFRVLLPLAPVAAEVRS